MEMIAMLGGLGATSPYLENPSPAARAANNAIAAAKTVDEVMAVKTGLPNMGLSAAEVSTLALIADKKIEEILNPTPFYTRVWFWGLVAAGAAAWYHRDKIKSAIGLSGFGAYNPKAMNPGTARPKAGWKTFDPYAKQTEMAKKIDDARWEARQKAKKARRLEKRRANRAAKKKAAR